MSPVVVLTPCETNLEDDSRWYCALHYSFKLIIQNYTGCDIKASYRNLVILIRSQSCMRFKEKISFLEVLTFYANVIFNLDFMIVPFEFSQG